MAPQHDVEVSAAVGAPEAQTAGLSGFEGCEKRLEVSFRLPAGAAPPGLRAMPRAEIDAFLALARCTVISVSRNDEFDAYVLSESSLFVFPGRVVVKTCGRTSTLRCLPRLLKAAEALGAVPTRVRYSRCNFIFPREQPFQYRSFNLEVQYLNTLFEGGTAHVLGAINGPRWHVYTADLSGEAAGDDAGAGDGSVTTLEICMFDLDDEVMNRYFHGGCDAGEGADPKLVAARPRTGVEATRGGGIDTIMPGATVDDFLFEPCGYSCNALLGGTYFTIHITPERHCSFVSFETNVPAGADLTDLSRRVLGLFRPGHFLVQVFADGAGAPPAATAVEWRGLGRRRTGLSSHEFDGPRSVTVGVYGRPPVRRAAAAPAAASAAAAAGAAAEEEPATHGPLRRETSQHMLASSADLLHGAESIGICHSVEEQLADQFHVPYSLAARLEADHLVSLAVAASRQRGLAVEEVSRGEADAPGALAREAAEAAGAPVSRVVNVARVVERFRAWADAFPAAQPFFSVKCNADPAVLCSVNALGCGFACATDAEVRAALAAGGAPDRVFYNRPWKSDADVARARELGLGLVSVDSVAELRKVHRVHPAARLLLCVSLPDAAPGAHGCSPAAARGVLDEARALGAWVEGVSLSAGGVPLPPARFASLLAAAADVFDAAAEALGRPLRVLDLGAGFPSQGGVEPLAKAAAPLLGPGGRLAGARLMARPAVFLAATAQAVAVSVVARSGTGGVSVSDGLYGAFSSLLYDSAHRLPPASVVPRRGAAPAKAKATDDGDDDDDAATDVFGPTGQASDCLARGVSLPRSLEVGDWLCFRNAGVVGSPADPAPATRHVFHA